MKYLDPKTLAGSASRRQRKRQKRRRLLILAIALLVLGVTCLVGVMKLQQDHTLTKTKVTKVAAKTKVAPTPTPIPHLKDFTAEEFRNLYNSFAYPNTDQIESPPPVTDNEAADGHIRILAEGRGYRLRSLARGDLAIIEGVQLQPLAIQPWVTLKAQAKAAGLDLTLTAGFRSYDDQKQLFMDEFTARGLDAQTLANGDQDDQVNEIMDRVAPPGYSRHHTGFTVDLQCGSEGLYAFSNSNCYNWLAEDNFKRAKDLGWVPSYPKGASLQGPEPEPWEFIWVGRSALLTN